MIDTGANKGEAYGDIYTLFDAHIFDGDKALIVILRDDDIKFAASRAHEHRVACEGA